MNNATILCTALISFAVPAHSMHKNIALKPEYTLLGATGLSMATAHYFYKKTCSLSQQMQNEKFTPEQKDVISHQGNTAMGRFFMASCCGSACAGALGTLLLVKYAKTNKS